MPNPTNTPKLDPRSATARCRDGGGHHPDFPAPTMVGIYAVDQYYGGPEEGGWWYTRMRHIQSILIANSPTACFDAGIRWATSRGMAVEGVHCGPEDWRYVRSHTSCGPDAATHMVCWETHSGEHDNYNTPRPRYE